MLTSKNLMRAVVCSMLLGSSLVMTGCSKKEKGTATGALLGAGAGAGLGAVIGNGTGAAVGAGVGAVGGGLLGNALAEDDEYK